MVMRTEGHLCSLPLGWDKPELEQSCGNTCSEVVILCFAAGQGQADSSAQCLHSQQQPLPGQF